MNISISDSNVQVRIKRKKLVIKYGELIAFFNYFIRISKWMTFNNIRFFTIGFYSDTSHTPFTLPDGILDDFYYKNGIWNKNGTLYDKELMDVLQKLIGAGDVHIEYNSSDDSDNDSSSDDNI